MTGSDSQILPVCGIPYAVSDENTFRLNSEKLLFPVKTNHEYSTLFEKINICLHIMYFSQINPRSLA